HTTPPSPLSLHDALPIFRYAALLHLSDPFLRQTSALPHALRNRKGQARIHTRLIDQVQHDIVAAADDRLDRACTVADQFLCVAEDRKSTRLNSSHVKISY